MKRSHRLWLVFGLMVVTVAIAGVRIQAWNPATHIYIAQKVYPAYAQRTDLWYGAIAPDLAIYVTDAAKWPAAFWDTHWTYIDLRPWALTSAQRIFARGWNTHNEKKGADAYAHGTPPAYAEGYISQKAATFSFIVPPDLAHLLVEAAVDILLKRGIPGLSQQTLIAVISRSWEDADLLNRTFVWWPLRRTDWWTLTTTELTYRTVAFNYAKALNQAPPGDVPAVATYGLELARQLYPDLTITQAGVEYLLNQAMTICAYDYQSEIVSTVNAIPRW